MSTHTKSQTVGGEKLKWWVGGDLNAAFGLGFNVLVNVLVLTSLCVGVLQIPKGDVFGVILPRWASSS
jgi:AGZA family xanthine/uracil permease-like MFS transporter